MKVKSGDSVKRNIDADTFVRKINNAEVKIVAITNHNLFDINQYNNFTQKANNEFQIWPGIELDINDIENKRGHLIVIANPAIVEEFHKTTLELINGIHPDTFSADIEKVIEKFNSKDVIYIAHSGGKKQSLTDETIKKIDFIIKEKYRLFKEPSNFKTLSIMSNVGFKVIIGSDVSDWDKYNDFKFAELKLKIDSFEQFILLSKKDVGTVKTLLEKKQKQDLQIKVSIDNNKKVDMSIPIYNDVNILFGAKGTGKTAILLGLNDKYNNDGGDISFYAAKDSDSIIDNMLKENKGERSLKKLNLEYLKTCFEDIKKWRETTFTEIKQYINYCETKNFNTNKNNLKITIMRKLNNITPKKYRAEKEVLSIIEDIINNYKKIGLKEILKSKELIELTNINNKIFKSIEEKLKKEYIEYLSKEFTNNCITKIKERADIYTTSKSLPNSTGFLDFAKNRLVLKINIDRILVGFNEAKIEEKTKVGELDNNKCIYLKTIYKAYSKGDNGFKYGKHNKNLKPIFEIISKIKENYFESINDDMMKLIALIIDENIDFEDFVGIKKSFVNQDDAEYTPSDGEKIMLVLHKALMANKQIYILDEPERSLGNSFINDVVLPRINDIAREGKTVIIATHNANIAVRSLPFVSILKDYNNGKYNTYIGNPFTNKLINTENEIDVKDWKDESMRILEGGKEAFNEREDIYESR
jgi:predicted ATPase/ribosomal protein L7Ae-like RNA K-turn-binding protein